MLNTNNLALHAIAVKTVSLAHLKNIESTVSSISFLRQNQINQSNQIYLTAQIKAISGQRIFLEPF